MDYYNDNCISCARGDRCKETSYCDGDYYLDPMDMYKAMVEDALCRNVECIGY